MYQKFQICTFLYNFKHVIFQEEEAEEALLPRAAKLKAAGVDMDENDDGRTKRAQQRGRGKRSGPPGAHRFPARFPRVLFLFFAFLVGMCCAACSCLEGLS